MQTNKIKNIIRIQYNSKKIKKSWVFVFLSQPNIYFLKLFKNTLLVGGSTFLLCLFVYFLGLEGRIPPSLHGLVGTIIALLLVFRTNTAYDRWWDGVKQVSSISNHINFFILKLVSSFRGKDKSKLEEIKASLKESVFNLKSFLEVAEHKKNHDKLFNDNVYKIIVELKNMNNLGYLSEKDCVSLEVEIKELIQCYESCKRIKNTPIPTSYALHIKISLFIYLLTLPFGLFADMGLYSCFMVMILYYIVGGIELISNEIENPFVKDPNDIPLDEIELGMYKMIDENFSKIDATK